MLTVFGPLIVGMTTAVVKYASASTHHHWLSMQLKIQSQAPYVLPWRGIILAWHFQRCICWEGGWDGHIKHAFGLNAW